MSRAIGIVIHQFSRYVRSRPAVVIFERFQSYYHGLVWNASKERYLALCKFYLAIDTTSRVDVVVHKLCVNDYNHSEIISDQKDSPVDCTSKSYA